MPLIQTGMNAGGVAIAVPMSGDILDSHFMESNGGTPLATTATRIYYVPIWIEHAVAYTGIYVYNEAATDNGETFYVAMYDQHPTSGGPRTRMATSSLGTLTAASALRTMTFTSAWTPGGKGLYFLMFHANSAQSWYAVKANATSPQNHISMPYPNGVASWGGGAYNTSIVRYVDSAFGAPASTAVAPTSATTLAPMMRLYR